MIAHSKPLLGTEEAEAAARVIGSGMVAQGREVEAFEAECAAKIGRQHAVAVSSGTAALHLALLALELPRESAAAFPAYACAALPCAVAMAGLKALPLDVDGDGNLLVDSVPSGAGAVLLPHLFGKPAAMPAGDAPVVEDIAQSIGNGTGQRGILAIASFYATKMLTTGEGGMVLTDDANLAEVVRDLRDYDKRGDGRARFNYKMTDIQAAIGRVQLRRLDEFIARRREIAARYTEAWRELPLVLPGGDEHVYYRYAVRVTAPPARNHRPAADTEKHHDGTPGPGAAASALMEHLNEAGIDAKAPVYPPGPVPNVLPGAVKAYAEFVSIPLYPALSAPDELCVIEAMQRFFD